MDSVSDDVLQVLAASYAAGDHGTIHRVLGEFRSFLLRVVERRFDPRMRARIDPADVVQESLIEASQRLGDYLVRQPMSVRAWLHQTACQRLQMAWREHRRSQRRSVDREVPLIDNTSLALAHSLLGKSPSAYLLQQELVERIQLSIDRLPTCDRDLILMRNFDNLSNQEVAELLGIQASAASKRYGRALLRLREMLIAANSDH